MWLMHKEETDEVKIMHGRNNHDYILPELPGYILDVYCCENRTVYEFCEFHCHGD